MSAKYPSLKTKRFYRGWLSQVKAKRWSEEKEFADSSIGAGPILRVLNKLKKTAVLMHYKMPGGYSKTFYTETLRPEVQPFGIPLLAKTVSLLYNFH